MSSVLSFTSNTIPTFIYEPFSYTISNPAPGTYTLTTSNTPGIPPGYLVNNGSNVVFSTTSNAMSVGTEVFVVTATSGSTVLTSSNTVTVGAGRFLDASGVSYAGRNFSFFRNEPITPITLVAPFAISLPTSVPTLPPGLTYTSNASNIYSITGTPLVTVPQSNYLVIGKATGSNLGKIVTSQFGISVSNERVIVNLSGTPIVSSMTIGTPISSRVITTAYPPYPSGGTLRYSWSGLPDGIVVQDFSGNTQIGTFFTPTDPSSTLIISGTPTITAANAYRDAEITSNVVIFTATRTNPLPQISNSQAISFAFGETVLFDTPSVPTLYSGVALDPSAIFFRAQTYFGTASPITNIFSPDLRSDLSINFVASQGRGYLTGTPSTTGTASYTIRAINSNTISRDLSVPITVAADSVTFVSPPTPAVDVCYNFVLSRPSSLALTGYYPSNIQFTATAASGKPVTFSAPALSGTGLSLSNVGSNTVQIVGTPDTITPLTTVTVTASAVGTPATATRDFKLAVLNDVITIAAVSASLLTFIQNVAITPVQFSATTLSERPIISFSGSNLPNGLLLTGTGLLTGTPTTDVSSSFTVVASTGYTSQNKSFSYALTPDTILFFVQPSSYTYSLNDSVNIQVRGLSYSGNTGLSNFTLSGLTPTCGLSIDSSTGLLSGTLVYGTPPDPPFPVSPGSFTITANVGNVIGTLPSTFSVANGPVNRAFLTFRTGTGGLTARLYTNDDGTYETWSNKNEVGGTILSLKNTSVNSNVFLLATGRNDYRRSTNGATWTSFVLNSNDSLDTAYQFLYNSSNSRWYAAGATLVTDPFSLPYTAIGIWSSSNDGISWNKLATVNTTPRVYSDEAIQNYYVANGVALAYKDGVYLVGGGSTLSLPETIRRSTDGGSNWNSVTGAFEAEVATFELSGPVWIAAGSSVYSGGSSYFDFSAPANTLKWSDNQGTTWNNATGAGVFSVSGRIVAYSTNRWLAAGFIQGSSASTVKTALSYSDDGKIWYSITLPLIVFNSLTAFTIMPLPEITSIWTDDSNWYVLAYLEAADNKKIARIFQHSLTGSLTTGWTVKVSAADPFSGDVPGEYLHGFVANYVELTGAPIITLSFNTLAPNGPVVSSPTNRSFTFYQYVPIQPIVFSATGTGTIYYFVEDITLPRGIEFDALTATLSGTSVVLGEKSFIVYVKDNIGITAITITVNTIVPRVIRQQDSAGAWTSLVRQYTIVNAAQNSVNGRALPATEPTLGEFMRPEPPDSVSASGNPNCEKC